MARLPYPKALRFVSSAVALGLMLASTQAPAEEAEKPSLDLKRDYTPLAQPAGGKMVSFADVLEPITPAVVSVHTAHSPEDDPRRRALEEMMRRYFGLPPQEERPSAPEDAEPEPSGLGSGFIVSQDGFILTNNHVVKGYYDKDPETITVKLADGREFKAELIGADAETDVAVLKIEAEGLPFLTLGDSSQLRVGDIVFAVGNPLKIGLTVTQGIVSATNRTDLGILQGGFENFIQTDAAINRGNSGGPLIDGLGRVIGINTAIISDSFSGGNIGIGFAIPIDLAANVMESLVEGGAVQRGFIGIRPEPLTRELANAFGLDSIKGALVARVTPGLPASQAGLRHGDVILTVNQEQVDSVNDLIYLISQLNPGSVAKLGISRGGKSMDIDVTLGDRTQLIGQALGEAPAKPARTLFEGVSVQPVTDARRAEAELPEDIKGLLIEEIEPTSPYATALAPGMVIMEINGQAVESLESAKSALKAEGKVNALYIYFQGNYTYTTLIVKEG